jgi:DNA-3-methyladenine glycosylase II
MQKCGMTLRKAGYIKGIGESVINGDIDFSSLNAMSDQKIIKTLTTLKGVGIWTVEMLMIFSLSRPDIVSFGDLAIRKGMMNLYNINELTKEKFLKHREVYSPYGSVASLYLWELSGGF